MEEREVFKGGIEERTVSKEVKLFELIECQENVNLLTKFSLCCLIIHSRGAWG